MIGVALLGAGYAARIQLASWQEIPGASVIGVWNRSAERSRALAAEFGVPAIPWLSSQFWAMPAIALMKVWGDVGFYAVIFLAALQGVDTQLYEAAELDGANFVQRFLKITVPMLKPATFFILVTSLIGNFQTFDLIYILTEGGPANSTSVVTYRIYQTAFQEFRMGLASAQSVILLLILVVLALLSRKIVGGTDGD